MTNTNYFSGIVKILETPQEYFVNQQIQVTKFRVEISQRRKNTGRHLLPSTTPDDTQFSKRLACNADKFKEQTRAKHH